MNLTKAPHARLEPDGRWTYLERDLPRVPAEAAVEKAMIGMLVELDGSYSIVTRVRFETREAG